MLKKGLFVITMLCILSISAQAGTTTIDLPLNNWGGSGWVKIDSVTDANFLKKVTIDDWCSYWPGTVKITVDYTPLTLCCIPIYLEVGMYAEVKDCGSQKITMKQVACGDIGKGTGDYPCYKGCRNIAVRGNFPMVLGLSLNIDQNNILTGSNTKAKYVAPDASYDGYDPGANYVAVNPNAGGGSVNVPAGLPNGANSYYLTAICVEAWKANLMYQTMPPSNCAQPSVKVGEVCITVKPQ